MSHNQYPGGYGQQYGAPPGHPPQGGYYPPPQGHSPYPGQAYGPPGGQFPPPHSSYLQHQQPGYPPQGPPPGYGHTHSYGAPPPQPGYGGPGGYGAPPPQDYPPTQPTLGYGPPQIINWDASADAHALRQAMKGWGTDEKALIQILYSKDPLQIEAIKTAYFRIHSRSLEKDVMSETSGYFEKGLVAIIQGPLLHDCHLLYNAMEGPGTNENVLNDVLLGRSNADLNAIKAKFHQTFGRSLESMVQGDLSMKTERHFMIVLGANRAEDSAPVIPQQIDQDVMDLYKATEAKLGTDEMMVCSILSTRNDNQIRAICNLYEQKFRRRLEEVIRKEFSGHMEDALLFQLRHAADKYMHAAALLEDSMAGLGTKDHLLVSRVVRFHWNRNTMANVRGAYQQRYNRSLSSRIKGETSGDYMRLMLACVDE
jgi:annexin A7/11